MQWYRITWGPKLLQRKLPLRVPTVSLLSSDLSLSKNYEVGYKILQLIIIAMKSRIDVEFVDKPDEIGSLWAKWSRTARIPHNARILGKGRPMNTPPHFHLSCKSLWSQRHTSMEICSSCFPSLVCWLKQVEDLQTNLMPFRVFSKTLQKIPSIFMFQISSLQIEKVEHFLCVFLYFTDDAKKTFLSVFIVLFKWSS